MNYTYINSTIAYNDTLSIFVRAEAMAAEIKELQGEMADINTVKLCA